MKKLLSLLGAVGIIATSSSSVMAMAPNQQQVNPSNACLKFIPVDWKSDPKWVTVNGLTSNDGSFDCTREQMFYWNQFGLESYDEFTKSTLVLNFKGVSYNLKLGDKYESKALYNETRKLDNFSVVVADHETYLLGQRANVESTRLPRNENFVKAEISYKVSYYGVEVKLSTYGFAHGTWGNWVGAGGRMSWEGGLEYNVFAK